MDLFIASSHSFFQGVSEMEKLKDIFARSIFYLEEKGMAKAPYHLAVQEAVDRVKKEVTLLKTAPACIPPCGYQKEARQYQCSSCSMVDCQLPIDCPIQDMHKLEGETALLRCEVQFQIPSDCSYRWKFIRDARTRELYFFQDMNFGYNPSLLIRPTLGSHHGSYVCEIAQGNEVLARKFFFLNGQYIIGPQALIHE
uniref:Ig-like domain-containing protein n=1 Tax=Salvator merianae TaxID=96440 RepID=A0A8D0BKR5_SALMN